VYVIKQSSHAPTKSWNYKLDVSTHGKSWEITPVREHLLLEPHKVLVEFNHLQTWKTILSSKLINFIQPTSVSVDVSTMPVAYLGVVYVSTCEFIQQESCTIAKMTAQCALYMGALKIFGTP